MGLSICQTILQTLGGSIRLEDGVESGAIFMSLYLQQSRFGTPDAVQYWEGPADAGHSYFTE
jgi:K+-sensing histidine kinase KdpD